MKTNIAIFLLTVVFSLFTLKNSISQNSTATDSLKMLLNKSSGIEKANLLKEIGDNYQQAEYHQKAIKKYIKALEIYNEYKDTLLQAIVLGKIGNSYFDSFDFDKSLKYYYKALKYYEKINNKNGISKTFIRIGNTYKGVSNNDKALEYYLKSYKISEQTGNKKGLYTVFNNIGSIYSKEVNTYDKALEYFNKSLLLIKESNDSSKISIPIQNIALVYFYMQNYDTALYFYFKALHLNEKYNNRLGIARVTSNIANLYVEINNLESAKEYLDRSVEISKEIEAKGITANNYYDYTLVYAIKGDLNKMRKYSDFYFNISDTIINEQNSHLIAEMQTKYETEKKEQQIEMLNIENKFKEVQLQARTYWLLIFIIAFALVITFVVILLIQKRRLHFANTNLVQKNLEIVKSEKRLIDANTKLNIVINKHDKSSMDNTKSITIKYTNSPLTNNQKQDIKNSIIYYMNSSDNYLNIDFSINTLAKDLDISRSYISQVINELFQQNFSNFLNEYRIKEARKKLSSTNFIYTIEAVAGLVGYKSKSAFNKAFKKYVGVTPSFYIDLMKNKSNSQ